MIYGHFDYLEALMITMVMMMTIMTTIITTMTTTTSSNNDANVQLLIEKVRSQKME